MSSDRLEFGSLKGKKILFFVDGDLTFRVRQYKEALSLHENGAEVTFFCIGEADSEMWKHSPFRILEWPRLFDKPRYSKLKSRFFRIGLNLTYYRLVRLCDDIGKRRRALKVIEKGVALNPDVVHAVDLSALRVGALIAEKAGAKLIYDSCDYWKGFLSNYVWSDSHRIAKRLALDEQLYISKADFVLVTGKTMQSQLSEDYGITNCEIIYNSVDIDLTNLHHEQVGDVVKFIYHGAITPDRNVNMLIDVISKLPLNTSLDIYGEFISCNQDDFETQIHNLHLDNRVKIYGRFSFAEMLEFLPKYDVGIYLAQKTDENFDITVPTKLFDCICAGLAVVMPNFKSIREELSDLKCGILVNTDDKEAVIKSVTELVKNPQSICNFKNASFEAEPRYNWTRQGKHLVELYQKLF